MTREVDLDRLVREEIARLVREGKLQPSPDPDLVDLAALLAALEEADRIARALDLPRVRIRIANARREARR